MNTPLHLFWWSPRRDFPLASRELRSGYRTWLRMRLHGGSALTNFGDELSPLVLSYVTGQRVQWAPAHRAAIVSVGSILEYVNKRTRNQPWIWGTGLREEPRATGIPEIAMSDKVLAVRGPLSRQALGLNMDLPIGDPGVLAPVLGRFHGLHRRGTLFIPHFRTWATRSGQDLLTLAKSAGYEIANPSLPPLEMIALIARADLVLSSSLHGVIVANALGIPAQLVSIPASGRNEPHFKYEDYFQSVGIRFSSIAANTALLAENRASILASRDAVASTAKANCEKLAEHLSLAIERVR